MLPTINMIKCLFLCVLASHIPLEVTKVLQSSLKSFLNMAPDSFVFSYILNRICNFCVNMPLLFFATNDFNEYYYISTKRLDIV
jgi:hypothetical protein